MDDDDVPWGMTEDVCDLASLTSTECLQVATMLRETMMPSMTVRHRELAEEAAERFERRALTQVSGSRG